jgi:hypothetical protein
MLLGKDEEQDRGNHGRSQVAEDEVPARRMLAHEIHDAHWKCESQAARFRRDYRTSEDPEIG